MKFYRCKGCGQIVGIVKETGVPLVCCGMNMEELIPLFKEEGLTEKHVPVYKFNKGGVEVNVGSIVHPMTSDHYIEWIALVTDKGNQRRRLKPGDAPKANFCLEKGEKVLAIYAYCNIHSLWEVKLEKK
ncbi:MAG: desulfoferrodoxin [Bacilli bacterium]|nr:desulfoferrodoxin [Bacilli bacterium]